MKFKAIRKSSTPEMIINEIVQHIKSGELKPGDRLPTEREMSLMFGVGRSSIREAVKGLVLSGYLASAQGKGTFVRKNLPAMDLTLDDLRNVLAAERIVALMELRIILECKAAELAAQRANADDIRRIYDVLERMQACRKDIKKFYRPDFDFHVAVAEASHNEMICEMMKLIVEKSHAYYEKFMPERLCPPEQAIQTARKIADCLAKGQGQKASRYMKAHLDLVEIELQRVIDSRK